MEQKGSWHFARNYSHHAWSGDFIGFVVDYGFDLSKQSSKKPPQLIMVERPSREHK
jgi:spore germination protein YaaH